MNKKEAKELIANGKHQLYFCPTCKVATVSCGICGLNVCSGSSTDGCQGCEEAYKIYQSHVFPWHIRIRGWWYHRVAVLPTIWSNRVRRWWEKNSPG